MEAFARFFAFTATPCLNDAQDQCAQGEGRHIIRRLIVTAFGNSNR